MFFPPAGGKGAQRGFAMVAVLGLTVGLLIFVAVMLFRTRTQRETHSLLTTQAKALLAARGAMQLALYKFRVLPTEFYLFASATRSLPPDPANVYRRAWMNDLDSSVSGSLGAKLADSLRTYDGGRYALGISKFELLTREREGYRKDFIRIEAWGEYEDQKKVLEELLEVEVTHD